ncbi:JmjC domain-containing protein [Pedococcus sp. 5OH_020]|uniref:JmjC domain-containing protein n=1 Tax=Pedococcus sp. 5OH_020 TaxID=2989814 RepID=UPI0022EA0E88|nr:cupin domain-containing protein [Pedococcus sp. 5OH_020]
MTAPASSRVSSPPSGHPALGRLVSTPPEIFAGRYWGREPLLSRAAGLPRDFADLFSAVAVDELVSARGLRTPFLRVAKAGTTLPERTFTRGAGVGATISDQVSDDALFAQFRAGATLVLQGLHRVWAPVLRLSQELAAELGHPTQVNAYVTPPESTGFSDHYDVHDVFVLQVEGEKQWRVRPPVHPLPLRNQPWTDRRAAVQEAAEGAPLLETTLRPGDCLYLPRGYLHSATALGGVSIHLTVGVHPWTRHTVGQHVLRLALARAAQDPQVRCSLPLATDAVDPRAHPAEVDLVRAALHKAIDDLDVAELASALAATARGAQPAAPLRPLAQRAAVERLGPQDELRPRDHLAARWEGSDGVAVLTTRAGRLSVEPAEQALVEQFLASRRTSAADLGLALARRLMEQGIAVPV